MKFNSIFLLVVIFLSALALVTSQDDGSKGRANPLLRRAGARPGTKTSTTTPPPAEEGELGEEDYAEGEGEEAAAEPEEPAPTTSTEPPKKIGPIIRPFRSNDDLLNALRRRQMNVKPGVYKPLRPAAGGDEEENRDAAAPASSAKSASKDSGSRRRFGGNSKSAPAEEEEEIIEGDAAAPKKPSRFNLRSSRS